MNRPFFRRGTGAADGAVGSSGALPLLFALLIVGFVGILLYAIASADHRLSIASIATLVAGGASLVGGLIGFLFGIPRTLVYDRPSPEVQFGAESRSSDKEDRRLPEFDPNTNLEQISDWLTKILVGVGLTQLSEVPSALNQAATAIESGLGIPPQNHVFALAILIYFPMCGFFVGYLWARVFLPNVLTKAERARLEEKERTYREREEIVREALQKERQEKEQEGEEILREALQLPETVTKRLGLWVDDNPSNNTSLKQAFESLFNIEIALSLSTEDALQRLKSSPEKYSFVISDMGRQKDPKAGYTLLHALKELGAQVPPVIIYATGASIPSHRAEATRAGALGSTSSPQELRQLLQDVLS